MQNTFPGIKGFSRSNVLVMQIESGLYHRQGNALNNFHTTLPSSQSDLANQMLKDPYSFDFLTLTDRAHEQDFLKALSRYIVLTYIPRKATTLYRYLQGIAVDMYGLSGQQCIEDTSGLCKTFSGGSKPILRPAFNRFL